MQRHRAAILSVAATALLGPALGGCNSASDTGVKRPNSSGTGATHAGGTGLKGEIKIDGSSTVYLITEAMATDFKKQHPGVNITVGISGTGGGFKKFSAGETDISDASRPIKPAEADACKARDVAFTELQVGWDGLAVIINRENTWAKKMNVAQLKKIWHPDSNDFK